MAPVEENELEWSILEAISFLRKKRRCSNETNIVERITTAVNPNLTREDISSQIEKNLATGRIKKVKT